MLLSKNRMNNLVEDIVKTNGYPKRIEVVSKTVKQSELTGKKLRYGNQIYLCYDKNKKFLVNESFYYVHCSSIIDEINSLIETLKEESK